MQYPFQPSRLRPFARPHSPRVARAVVTVPNTVRSDELSSILPDDYAHSYPLTFERMRLLGLVAKGRRLKPPDPPDPFSPPPIQKDIVHAIADQAYLRIEAFESCALSAEEGERRAVQLLTENEQMLAASRQQEVEAQKSWAMEVSELHSELKRKASSEQKLIALVEDLRKAEAMAVEVQTRATCSEHTEAEALAGTRTELVQVKNELASLQAAKMDTVRYNSSLQDELQSAQQVLLSTASELASVKSSEESTAEALKAAEQKIESLETAHALLQNDFRSLSAAKKHDE
eukprot:gnl/MRDRNA2_/MRDRNA2_56656_c0_seq1.p1 gnl/MRDRNA2_/MRDRNA2_56656_c0~~gnl/MRDRNA2_/MRDRNA2_56656_c0_seq1.p1  ORF type:complete len:289 (-),score=69.17 gnl/MRDRNA2_/MRDRNA2_56656_c0_seq1:317-1183(-)